MAWKPKTIAGKILKGALIGTGSVIGLGAGLGAIKGLKAGTGVIKGALSGLSSTKGNISKISTSAVNLISGTTKEERAQIEEIKKEAKAARDKKEQVDRLVNAGASLEKALSMVGISKSEYSGEAVPDLETEKKTYSEMVEDAETVKTAGIFGNKNMIYFVAAAVALLFLPKLLKR